MELVKADDVFQEACALLEGKRRDGTPCTEDLPHAEYLLNELLNSNPAEPLVLHVIASLFLKKGYAALAATLWRDVLVKKPDFGEAWNDLGLAFQMLECPDDAARACEEAAKYLPNSDVFCNVSSCYLNRTTAEKALAWADRALEKKPDHVKARWHKAMALLELQRWSEAWDYHESRLDGGGSYSIEPRHYPGNPPRWDGQSKGLVAVHGEQGMGDEIMFASCIPDALATGVKLIIEPSPRMHNLFKRTFPGAVVFGTNAVDGRAWIDEYGKPDFMCALGSLPKFYRRSTASFPRRPYLVPDPFRRKLALAKLAALGPRPKIGLAWAGGVKATGDRKRSMHPRWLAQLFRHDVDFVSLQYDPSARGNVADVRNEFGVEIHHWPELVEAIQPGKVASDIDDLAALVSCLDMVITVPQTCYHVAGALGVPCIVMVPSEPDWRLAGDGDQEPWYGSVSLIRQPRGTFDWLTVINEVDRRLAEFLEQNLSTNAGVGE